MSLKSDMAADLSGVFFNTEDFAESAVYTPKTGSAYSINGHFDAAYESVDPGSGASVMSTHPVFKTYAAALATTPGTGDTLTVNSVVYRVKTSQPDGVGVVDLYLLKN